jgi:hypothetical protein
MAVLGVSLVLLGPVLHDRAREVIGAFIEAFWNSPFGPF